MSQARPPLQIVRPAHVVLCAAVVAIVYGSLFPFDFQAQTVSLAEVLSHWNPFFNRADAVDNVLLFVPLGMALYFCFDRTLMRGIASVLAWLILGLGLQWIQLFVPGRVPSLADAINNAIGLSLGLWVAGRIGPWVAGRRLANSTGDTFALLLVLAWYAYESFPFVPTLDVGLLGQHLKSALALEPFDVLRFARHALAGTLGTMLLLRAHPLHSRRANLVIAAIVVLLSELLVPYGGLRVETLVGIVTGLILGETLDRSFGPSSRGIVMALALVAFATTVGTPFRAQPTGGGFTLTPFSGLLWFGNTSGIPPAAFETLAIGALLWSGLQPSAQASGFARNWQWLVLALLILAELVRVQVLGFRGDTTTLVLWIILAPLAHLMGQSYGATQAANGQLAQHADSRTGPRATAAASTARVRSFGRRRSIVLLHAATGLTCLTVGLWLLLQLPTIPYNVKELFDSPKLPRIMLFSAALMWLGWGPWWVAATAARSRTGPLWLPVLLFAAAMVSLLLLTFSVTQESLDDIIGSPDLLRRVTKDGLWGAEWSAWLSAWPTQPTQAIEQILRYAALYALLLIPLTIAAMQLCGRWSTPRKWIGVATAAATWWLAKLVVVDWAITDNLTELIARDGVPHLAMVLALLTANVAALMAARGVAGSLAAALLTVLFVPATWWLLLHGLEPILMKYGLVYSAVQFLLGQTRSLQLPEWQLFARWSLLYLAAIGTLAWGMRLARSATAPSGQ